MKHTILLKDQVVDALMIDMVRKNVLNDHEKLGMKDIPKAWKYLLGVDVNNLSKDYKTKKGIKIFSDRSKIEELAVDKETYPNLVSSFSSDLNTKVLNYKLVVRILDCGTTKLSLYKAI